MKCPVHDEPLFPHYYDKKGYCKRCIKWYWNEEINEIRKQIRGT